MSKVLIVEDDEGIADFLRFELEHEGYGVLHAADGRTATLLFRFPFTKTARESAQELARKIYLEKDDVICQ